MTEDRLADLAIDAESRRDEEQHLVRRRGGRPSTGAGRVYSVRLPEHAVEQLRQLGEELGIAPSALLRQWTLERLRAQQRPDSRAG